MDATQKLLDMFRETCSPKMDKEIARRLHVRDSAVSNWRNGRSRPNPDAVRQMCEATGESLAHWLPLVEAERATTPADRKVWLRLAATAASIAAIIGPLLIRIVENVYYVK